MKEIVCLTEQQILNANGRVVKNPDGTISVYTISQSTGQLAPSFLTKACCDSLNIEGAFFDSETQKCRWAGASCDYKTPFNLVLNPKGNDGAIFVTNPDETCTLSIEFDYLIKFNCSTLTDLATGVNIGDCTSILDVFESINASVVIDVVNTNPSGPALLTKFEEIFFNEIGNGNLYSYLSTNGDNSGFFICGGLTNNINDTECHPLNLYDLNITGDTVNCSIVRDQILQQLFDESGLPVTSAATFTQNVSKNAFGANWQHFHTEVTDPAVISGITNEKIKLTIKLSGSCIDTCILVDNIRLDKNCTKLTRNDLFVTKSPGFELDRIRDNKKSWVANTDSEHRTFDIRKSDNTQPIRITDYYLSDERQIINTKELDLDINLASAIETDVWGWIYKNPCLLTGGTIGTTSCVKDAFYPEGYPTWFTGNTSGYCCPVTAITSTTITVTGSTTAYTCQVGYTATPANDACQKLVVTGATLNSTGGTILAGARNSRYGSATLFYGDPQNLALPLHFSGLNLVDSSGVTLTSYGIQSSSSNHFWVNTGNTVDGRLSNVSLSASAFEWLGVVQCFDLLTPKTYYLGFAGDDNAELYIDGKLVVLVSFGGWYVFQLNFTSGKHEIFVRGLNGGPATPSALGFELYDPIDLPTLTAATSTAATQANVVATSLSYIGKTWDVGSTVGYSCPSGFIVDTCSGHTCVSISTTGISATTITGVTATTVTGYCTDISCVTYTVTGGTYVYSGYTVTATTSDYEFGSCLPKTYCCSEYCGDANIDLNRLFTQPLSSVTTVEDFEYYTLSELIDVKDRKTLSSYPTLRLLYDRYLNSKDYCNSVSAKFDYSKMNSFANLIGDYWTDLIEQVIPATTIWGSTKIYSNTIFDIEKFKYKAYSMFYGLNKFGDLKVLSPVTGATCGVEAITTVIQGTSSGTTLFFNQGDVNRYNRLFVIQNNSSSEFVGSVNILGSNNNGGNTINECSLQVTIVSSNNGTATAYPSGAQGPVTYSWNTTPVQTTQTATGLSANTYTVTVTDTSILGCSVSKLVPIAQNLSCGFNLTTTSVDSTNLLNNGTATANPSGGIAPYSYSWNTSPVQTTQTATGLSAGTYTVTVLDSEGCEVDADAIINITCNVLLSSTTVSSVNGLPNGSASVYVLNDVPPYTYSWNTTPVQTGATATGLSAGTYSVTVTDLEGCASMLAINVGSVPCNLALDISGTSTTATAIATNGNQPYTYVWTNSGLTAGTQQTLTGMTAGTYNIKVTDTAGCIITGSTTGGTFSPLILAFSIHNATNGSNTGSITVSVSGGTGPYTYSWNTVPTQTGATAIDLYPGIYSVTVTDSIGNIKTGSATVANIPCALGITVTATTSTATGIVSNGIAPYVYSWNTSPVQTTQTAIGLSAGTYSVTATDTAGCQIIGSTTIPNTISLLIIITNTNNDG